MLYIKKESFRMILLIVEYETIKRKKLAIIFLCKFGFKLVEKLNEMGLDAIDTNSGIGKRN